MGISGGNTIEVQVVGVQGIELCYANMEYSPVGENVQLDLNEFALQWTSVVQAPWLAVVSDKWRWLETRFKVRGTPNAGQTFTQVVNAVGGVVGDVLPVYNVFSLTKFPDNDTRYPANSNMFKKGRIQISGVPETAQSNRVIIPEVQADLYDLCDALHIIPALFNNPAMQMSMVTYSTTGFVKRAYVQTLIPGQLGTQLTRKR